MSNDFEDRQFEMDENRQLINAGPSSATYQGKTVTLPCRKVLEDGTENENYVAQLDPATDLFQPPLYASLRPEVDVYVRHDSENPHLDYVPVTAFRHRLELETESLHTVPVDHAEALVSAGLATVPKRKKASAVKAGARGR